MPRRRARGSRAGRLAKARAGNPTVSLPRPAAISISTQSAVPLAPVGKLPKPARPVAARSAQLCQLATTAEPKSIFYVYKKASDR